MTAPKVTMPSLQDRYLLLPHIRGWTGAGIELGQSTGEGGTCGVSSIRPDSPKVLRASPGACHATGLGDKISLA